MNNIIKFFVAAALMLGAFSIQAGLDDKSVRERTLPIGKVCLEGDDCGSAVAAAPAGPQSPEDVYNNSCAGCHATGALNAPKFGDAEAWGAVSYTHLTLPTKRIV